MVFIKDLRSCGIADWGKRSLNTILVTYNAGYYTIRPEACKGNESIAQDLHQSTNWVILISVIPPGTGRGKLRYEKVGDAKDSGFT